MRGTCASGSSTPVTIAAQRLRDPSIKNWSHRVQESVMTTTSEFCAAVVAARTSSCWIPVAPVPTQSLSFEHLGAAPQPCVQSGPHAENTIKIRNVDLPSQNLVHNRQYRDTVTCLPAHTEQGFAKVADARIFLFLEWQYHDTAPTNKLTGIKKQTRTTNEPMIQDNDKLV